MKQKEGYAVLIQFSLSFFIGNVSGKYVEAGREVGEN